MTDLFFIYYIYIRGIKAIYQKIILQGAVLMREENSIKGKQESS